MATTKSNSESLYSALGVKKAASADEIRRAYRKLAHKYHPDVNKDDKAAEDRFKEISAAYDVLGDDKKRELYDEFGEEALRTGFDADKAREHRRWAAGATSGFGSGSNGFGGFSGSAEGADLSEILSSMFGGAQGAQQNPYAGFAPQKRKGRDIQASVQVDLVQAIRGTNVDFTLPSGGTTTVRIPPGADSGSRLRVKGKGAPGQNGGPPGDLLIETKVKKHRFFRRDGLNLHLHLPVTLDEAINGATLQVPTPTGDVALRVPKRSQNGTVLRLKGKGVARGKKVGNMLVELDVRLPEKKSDKLSAAARELKDAYKTPLRKNLKL